MELLSQHRNVHEVLLQNYPGLLHSRSFSEPFSSHNGIPSPDNALLAVPTGDQAMTSEAEQMPWMRRRNSHHQKGVSLSLPHRSFIRFNENLQLFSRIEHQPQHILMI